MRQRQGFTLVEMLVAVALVLFIMVILTQAFTAGLDTFRQLKSIGDMEERLRTTTTLLRRDLAADKFEGKRRLSDLTFWQQGPPRNGFFRLYQGGTGSIIEGLDSDNHPSYLSYDHILHFSVKLRGNGLEDYFAAQANLNLAGLPNLSRYETSGVYKSQWAEVAYFMRPNGTTANGTPLFALYRRQLVAVPDNSQLNWGSNATLGTPVNCPAFAEMSAKPDPNTNNTTNPPPIPFTTNLYFNCPSDLTVPPRRFGMQSVSYQASPPPGGYKPQLQSAGIPLIFGNPSVPLLPNGAYPYLNDQQYAQSYEDNPAMYGADLLLMDVVSFDVRIMTPESLARAVNDALQNGNAVPLADPYIDLYDSYVTYLNKNQRASSQIPSLPNLTSANPVFSSSGPMVFDTWSSVEDDVHNSSMQTGYSNWNSSGNSTSAPLQIRILAVQVSIRLYDLKLQQTRQVTLVQDM